MRRRRETIASREPEVLAALRSYQTLDAERASLPLGAPRRRDLDQALLRLRCVLSRLGVSSN